MPETDWEDPEHDNNFVDSEALFENLDHPDPVERSLALGLIAVCAVIMGGLFAGISTALAP